MRCDVEVCKYALEVSIERAAGENRVGAGIPGGLEVGDGYVRPEGEDADGTGWIEGFPPGFTPQSPDKFERDFGGVEIDDQGSDGGVGQPVLEHLTRADGSARDARRLAGLLDSSGP